MTKYVNHIQLFSCIKYVIFVYGMPRKRFRLKILVLFSLFFISFTTLSNSQTINKTETKHYFIGRIDEKGTIQAYIVLGEDNNISGTFFSDTNGTSHDISGRIKTKEDSFNDFNIEIDAYVDKNKTGTFSGVIKSDGANLAETITGKWQTPEGDRTYAFELNKIADFIHTKFTQGSTIELSSSYPFMYSIVNQANQINDLLRNEIEKKTDDFIKEAQNYFSRKSSISGWSQEIKYSIEFYSKKLLSLTGETYTYTGGAHGNTFYISQNYSLTVENIKLINLSDLFIADSNFINILSIYLIKELKEQGASLIENGEITEFNEKDLHAFAISPRGLLFAFSPYSVASYAEGPFFVTVPYSEIRQIINPDGPLKEFINHQP